jgi:hypothetical protein
MLFHARQVLELTVIVILLLIKVFVNSLSSYLQGPTMCDFD